MSKYIWNMLFKYESYTNQLGDSASIVIKMNMDVNYKFIRRTFYIVDILCYSR